MTIHVPIGDATTRLPELVAAAVRGEDVVLDTAGTPQVRLVMVPPDAPETIERRAARRRSAIGMFADGAPNPDIEIAALKADDRWDEHYRRKFSDPD